MQLIFVTHKIDGVWSEPEIIPSRLAQTKVMSTVQPSCKTARHFCLSQGRWFWWIDIYCSKQDDNGDWLEPVNQGPNINTAAEEFHFTQDSDGTVYFTSNRPGGFGGMDIYGSMQQGENAWDPAYNLGPQVNTAAADMCPLCLPEQIPFLGFHQEDNSFGNIDIF